MSASQQLSEFDKVAATGARWIRWGLPMNAMEPHEGSYNWYADQEVDEAIKSGLHIDGLLSDPPTWAYSKNDFNVGAYLTFLQAAVEHYAPLGIHTYEIWNEENMKQAWGEAFSPSQFAALIIKADKEIKSVVPSATVIVGGLGPAPDSGTNSYEPTTFLTGCYEAGMAGWYDEIGDHPYSFPDLPSQQDSWNPFTYLGAMHQIMESWGDGSKKIWLTEYGAPTGGTDPNKVSQSFQAESITQAFSFAQSTNYIGPLFIYEWKDTAEDGTFDTGWGLYNSGGVARPALSAFETAAKNN